MAATENSTGPLICNRDYIGDLTTISLSYMNMKKAWLLIGFVHDVLGLLVALVYFV